MSTATGAHARDDARSRAQRADIKAVASGVTSELNKNVDTVSFNEVGYLPRVTSTAHESRCLFGRHQVHISPLLCKRLEDGGLLILSGG